MFLLKCPPLKEESLGFRVVSGKYPIGVGTGKEMGQISASKDIAYEMVLTVKPGVHGDCRGWRTEKGLHNSSVTKSYFGSRDHHAGIPFQLSCEFPSHRTAQKPRSRGQSSLLPESLHDWV